jgi:hypothetical protein
MLTTFEHSETVIQGQEAKGKRESLSYIFEWIALEQIIDYKTIGGTTLRIISSSFGSRSPKLDRREKKSFPSSLFSAKCPFHLFHFHLFHFHLFHFQNAEHHQTLFAFFTDRTNAALSEGTLGGSLASMMKCNY